MRSWPSSWELEWKERRTGWHLKAALSILGSRTNKLKDGGVGAGQGGGGDREGEEAVGRPKKQGLPDRL